MKQLYRLFCALILSLAWACSTDTPDEIAKSGSIAGSVSDRTTGEPVSAVNVTIEPGGASTVTGTDGAFSFRNLEIGNYTLTIKKEGYKDNSAAISVRAGEPTSAHLLIERIPDIVTADRDLLDFGDNSSTNTLSFNIVNAGFEDLTWEIEHRCEWITEVKPAKGTLAYGKTEAIVVVIDREKLATGSNEAVIVVRSSKGSSELKVRAIGEERYLPELNMMSVTDITSSTAVLHGKIVNPGKPGYTERGFLYSVEKIDPINAAKDKNVGKVSCPVTEEADYLCKLINLKKKQTYYARAYVIYRKEMLVSTNEVSFMADVTNPSVTIQPATDLNVARRSAILNGTVSYVGDPVYEEKGFVYSESPSPTIYDTKIIVEGNEGGIFRAPINNLDLNKIYYVRAYIKGEITYYSSETITVSLNTVDPKSEMLSVTEKNYSAKRAKFTGRITDVGSPVYTKRGFVFGLNSNPMVENDRVLIIAGNGTDEFSINVSDLQVNQKYFVRVFTEQEGKHFYSTRELDFILQPVAASVGNATVSEVDMNSAMLTSTVISAGDPEYTEKGFVFNTTGNPDITRNTGKVSASGRGEGQFSSRISSLTANTLYYARAYIIQNGSTYYGAETSFKTGKQVPVVTTNGASNIMYTSATLNATVTSLGDPSYNKRGFYYGTNSNPTASSSTTIIEDSGSFGDYSRNITGLSEKTTYYYRAFLLQPGDDKPIMGQVASFTTGHAPNVTTGEIYKIICNGTDENNLQWSCSICGGISDPGEPAYSEFGFVYGTSSQPTVNDGVSIYTTTTNFDWTNNTRIFYKDVSGLSTGTHYYLRAVAKTPLGYVYGEQVEFTPVVKAPEIRTYSTECRYIDDSVGWAVGFVGLHGSLGQPQATGFGFVYGTNTNPTIGDGSSIAVTYSKMEQSGDIYIFGTAVSGLTANKNYYVRVYAKTQLGYTYGEVMTFRTN